MIVCLNSSENSHRITKQFLRHYRFLSQRSCRLSRDRRQLRMHSACACQAARSSVHKNWAPQLGAGNPFGMRTGHSLSDKELKAVVDDAIKNRLCPEGSSELGGCSEQLEWRHLFYRGTPTKKQTIRIFQEQFFW